MCSRTIRSRSNFGAYEGDRFSEFSPLVRTGLYPLGEAFSGNYYWTIGADDQVYILMDDIQLLGKSTDEALENLSSVVCPRKSGE